MALENDDNKHTEALKMKLILGVVTSGELAQLVYETVRKKALCESTPKKPKTDEKED